MTKSEKAKGDLVPCSTSPQVRFCTLYERLRKTEFKTLSFLCLLKVRASFRLWFVSRECGVGGDRMTVSFAVPLYLYDGVRTSSARVSAVGAASLSRPWPKHRSLVVSVKRTQLYSVSSQEEYIVA